MKNNKSKSDRTITLIILILVVAIISLNIGFATGYIVGRRRPVKSEPTVTGPILEEEEEEEVEEEEVVEPQPPAEEPPVEEVLEPEETVKESLEEETPDETMLSWWITLNSEHKTPWIPDDVRALIDGNNAVYVGDTSEKSLYLTFDEGYEMGYTSKILDVLKEYGVKSIFFVTGSYIERNPELVQRMIDEGHLIGNHTINHPALPELSEEEFIREVGGLDDRIYEKFGVRTGYVRPPSGYYSEKTLKMTSDLGFTTVFWSFAYDDWYTDKIRGADYAYDIVMKNLHNGGIFLLHGVSKDNADALARIIEGIREEGYEINPFDL